MTQYHCIRLLHEGYLIAIFYVLYVHVNNIILRGKVVLYVLQYGRAYYISQSIPSCSMLHNIFHPVYTIRVRVLCNTNEIVVYENVYGKRIVYVCDYTR